MESGADGRRALRSPACPAPLDTASSSACSGPESPPPETSESRPIAPAGSPLLVFIVRPGGFRVPHPLLQGALPWGLSAARRRSDHLLSGADRSSAPYITQSLSSTIRPEGRVVSPSKASKHVRSVDGAQMGPAEVKPALSHGWWKGWGVGNLSPMSSATVAADSTSYQFNPGYAAPP
jgi:hypothetical protein